MALSFDLRVSDLNWLFLTLCIVISVVVLFYLFYFGRTLASIISVILRTILWRKYRAWIDIGSIQFSPLGGRLLFRDIRYVGQNETIRITMGHITWRYWLWRVRQDTDLQKDDTRLPCRTTVKLEGLEWFVYNRGPAFDMLLEQLKKREDRQSGSEEPEQDEEPLLRNGHAEKKEHMRLRHGSETTDSSSSASLGGQGRARTEHDPASVRIVPPSNDLPTQPKDSDSIDWFREALPIEVQIVKGAVVLGNSATPSLLIAGFKSALGTCGAVKSRSRFDFYKQVYQFSFAKPKIVFRKNHDYRESIESHGERMQQDVDLQSLHANRRMSSLLDFQAFQRILRRLSQFAERIYTPRPHKPPEPWHGLPRYQAVVGTLYDDDATGLKPADQQYAKASTIYDAGESIDFTYYSDVAGFVPSKAELNGRSNLGAVGLEKPDIGNGDLAPEWGIDLRLNGGTLTYGPWTDRQRAELQRTFFPPGFFDAEPTPRLKPGDRRMHAALKIYIDFSQTTSVRLPTRESSKDWKYDGMQDDRSIIDLGQRAYGWLDVRLGENSSISFVLPMLAGEGGYDTFLEVHLDEISLSSSVNYDTFLRSRICRVSCQLPQPLKWDDLHTWVISVALEQPEVFLLRDHTFLLVDLIKDWTSGPPASYEHFVPFLYKLDLTIKDYRLNLYLNERNIVDKAAIPQANTLLNLSGPVAKISVNVPSTAFASPFSTLTVGIDADDLSLAVNPPDWNTHAGFMTERTRTVGFVKRTQVTLAQTVYAVVHPDNVETLDVEVELDGIRLQVLGWVIKYFIEIKENYFGNFVHFVTPNEYRSRHADGIQGDPVEEKYRPGQSDIFEVNLNLVGRNSIALLPEEVHDCKSALGISIPEFGLHLRNYDYFMELAVNVDPSEMAFIKDCGSSLATFEFPPAESDNRWLLDNLAITSHRLFGPQPRTSVYVAVWEFTVGQLTANLTIPHVNALQRVARAFAANYADKDNALPSAYGVASDPDVILLSVNMEALDATIWSVDTAVNLLLKDGLSIRVDDFAEEDWLSHIDMALPSLQLRGLAPAEKDSEEWLEVVAIDTGLSLGLGKTSADYQVLQQHQWKFIQAQDALTRRAAALYSSAAHAQHDDEPSDRALYLPPLFKGSIAWAARLDENKHDFAAPDQPRTRRMSERRSVKISDRSARTFATSDTTSTTYDSLLRRAHRSRHFDITADNDDGFTFIVVGRDGQLGDNKVDRRVEVQTAKAMLRNDPANYKPTELGETLIRAHISFDRPCRAVCSPAAVKVAENIVTSLEKNNTAEHWLDDLGADYGGLIAAKEEIKPSTATSAVQVTASIASIQLRLVQDILRPGDIDMAEQLDGELPSDSAILSTTHISIKSISASFLRTFATDHYPAISLRQNGTLRAGKVRLQVRHSTDLASDRRTRLLDLGVPGSVDGTVLDLSVDGIGSQIRLQSDETRLGLEIAESNMSFVSSAAELITGTVHSWFIVSRAIETAVLRAHYQPLWRYRHLFAIVLQKAREEQIFAEPPFLNRPTIVLLRQRADMGWRVLAHVRHSYRHLSHAAKHRIREAFSDPTEVPESADYAVLMPLLQEWYGWDLEKEQIAQLGLFRQLFPTFCRPAPRPSRHTKETIDNLPEGEQPRRATAEPVISWETAIKARIATQTATVQFFEERGCKNRMVMTPCEVISAYGGKLPGETQDVKTRIILGVLAIELDPALLRLVRHVARVRKVFEVKLAPLLPRPRAQVPSSEQHEPPKTQAVRQVTAVAPRNLPVFASLVFESIDVSTQAHGVRASLTLNKIHACIDPTLHLHEEYGTILSLDGSAFLGCDSIRVLAATESKAKLDSQRTIPGRTLASMQLQDVHTHALLRDLSEGGLKILLTSIIGSSRIRIPRSILRMSQFVEHWREDSLPQSKVAFEELRKDLEKERSASPPRPGPSSTSTVPGSRIVLDANLAIPLVTCHIRAAQKLWLDYSVGDILLHARTRLIGTLLEEGEAGLRIGDQSVSFIAVSDSERLGEPLPFGGDSIKLPAFHGSVGYSKQELEVLASLERISVILTVDVLDSALAVQNRFEQDIDELLSVLSKRKAARSARSDTPAAISRDSADEEETPRLTKWKAQLALKGLNLGLRGPLSTQYIGADLVDGFIRQDLAGGMQDTRWEVSASNLALSLAQQTSVSSPRLPLAGSTGSASTFDRSYRLAYFVLDVHAGNQVSYIPELPQITENKDASHLHLRIPKLHAVMQTAAIEALDELIEHFSSEIALRRKARAAELASIKEKVIQTFEIPEKAASPRVLPWIERCVLSLRVESVGVAIPLEDIEIAAPWFGHRLDATSRTRPAFLLSAPSILFATSRATAGFASIADLSAQFVQAFDQTKPEHFSGLQHATQNRLLFPHAQLTIASDKASAAKMKAFTVRARMSGAELDIDPTIVNSTFALLDLYEIGYKRFARYTLEATAAKDAQENARDEAVPSAVTDDKSESEQTESLPSFIDTTTFEASFVVDSGIINMHGTSSRHVESKDDSQQSPKKSARPKPPRRGHSLSHKASIGLQLPSSGKSTSLAPDSFVIPKFTMWAIKREARQAGEQNNVHLDAVIHSSRNTLYPTLLPFLSEASDAIKDRMQHNKPLQAAEPDWVAETVNPNDLPGVPAARQQTQPTVEPSGIRNLRITFSLRIDRSRLEISCLQAAQVSAVLNWQSGGLLIAVQPGSRKLEVAARVDEVGFEIRHTFSPERCIGGSAQNLTLALSFAPYSESQTLLSGSFDASSITGDVNFRQLQDFLCFKAVWLDRLGQLVPLPDEHNAPPEQAVVPSVLQQTTVLVVIVAARLREIKLTLMLGQSIGTVELKASELVSRLRQVPNDAKSVGLDLQSFAITSRGRLSGYYNTSGLSLESTIRDLGGPLDELDGSHVKLGAVIGQMDGALEFDYRKVMLIESDPIRVAVTDEWTASHTDASRLRLHFSLVFGSVNVIMTTQTVPILVRLLDDLERLIEDRRVKARNALFGSSGILPDLRLVKKGTSIAEARKAAIAPKLPGGRVATASIIPAGTVVLGDIQLEAERLRLAIFLHHFTDQEAFRGDAGSIQARLERAVDGSGSVRRDLHLRLGFFSVRRLRPKPVSPNQEREFTIAEWLDLLRAAPERNIFKAPSAEVRMKSTQAARSHELHHRFSLKYVGTLDVSLNWAMLKQLGELLNAYKEGMRRIRQTDNGTAPSTPTLDVAVAASGVLNSSGGSEAKAEPVAGSDGKMTDRDTAVKKVAGEDIPAPPTVSTMGSLQYISPPGGIEIHNPQLTMLGDATPPLDWFGVKQGLYPGWVHEGVTVLLEKILLELSDVYQRTLERNAC